MPYRSRKLLGNRQQLVDTASRVVEIDIRVVIRIV